MTHPSDTTLTFQLLGTPVRGRLLRFSTLPHSVLSRHNYPPSVQDLLGQVIAIAALMASGLKYEGIFTLQIQGDGPITLLMADVTHDGDVRAYARFRVEDLPAMPDVPLSHLVGTKAYAAFTVDQGPNTQPYQGIAPLEGESLQCSIISYFQMSDQIPTHLKIFQAPDGTVSGIILQRLPAQPADEKIQDDWMRLGMILDTLTSTEMFDPALTSSKLLFRLFHEDGVQIFETRTFRDKCRCSAERLSAIIKNFSPQEQQNLIKQGMIEARCEVCDRTYTIDPHTLTKDETT